MSTTVDIPRLVARGAMLIAAVVCVVVVLVVSGGGSSYELKLELPNASGLEAGSQVLLGGVPVGSVDTLNLDRRRRLVIADLHLNRSDIQIGQGARASIVAANLLGEMYVALSPGHAGRPLPSGTVLPESATTVPTALDQIVDVLDGTTRARLAILLDEAGTAVAGRRSDVTAIMAQFPASLRTATRLLDATVQNNHTLADLVANSDAFIGTLDTQTSNLRSAIDAASGAATTFGQRASALTRDVTDLPVAMHRIVNAFYAGAGGIDATLPTLSTVIRSSPELTALLQEVKPFTAAAVPTLDRAASVAPTLTQLAAQGTPTVRQAVPTVSALAKIAMLAKPLSAWLGVSAPDLIAIPPSWASAVSWRDGISHTFQGEVYLDPQIVLGVADHAASAAQRCENILDIKSAPILRTLALLDAQDAARQSGCTQASRPARKAPARASSAAPARHAPTTPPPATPTGETGGRGTGLGSTVGKVLGGAVTTLGKVLGGVQAGLGSTLSHLGSALQPTGTTGQAGPGSPLRGLLSYLLGK